ncbi:MAG: amidohydrolase [Bacillota bacterium]
MKLIKAGIIYTGKNKIDNGEILINEQGKIVDVDKNINLKTKKSDNINIIDYTDKVIIPGLIDPHSHIGIWGDGEGPTAYDGNEITNAINGNIRALDAINPQQRSFNSAREGGITTAQIIPGSGSPIGGLAVTVKTSGNIVDEMIIKNPTGLKGALGENPKRAHGKEQNQAPASRMGNAALIRNYFQECKEYKNKKSKAVSKNNNFDLNLNYESGLKVLNNEIPFRIHAHRHDDIVTAIRISNEFNIDYSIEHCTDGHLIVDYLSEKNIWASVGPGLGISSKVETSEITDENPAILHKKGVNVSLMTDHPFLNCRYYMAYGATVHKFGLKKQETLKLMTLNPAKMLGIENRVGSLEKNKDADYLVLNSEPFSYKTKIEKTFIEDKEVYDRNNIDWL